MRDVWQRGRAWGWARVGGVYFRFVDVGTMVPGVCYVVMTLCWSDIGFLATIMMSTRDGGDYLIVAWAVNKDDVIGFYPYPVVSTRVHSSFCIISNHLTFASRRTKQPIPQPTPPSTPQGTLTNHAP